MKKRNCKSVLLVLALILFCTSYSSAQKNRKKKASAPAKEIVIDTIKIDYSKEKAPVVPFQDTIFYIYGHIGAMTAQRRAESIEKNIIELEKDMFFNSDSLKIEIEEDRYNITYLNKIVIAITEEQSKVLEKPKEQIAKEYLQIVINSIEKHRDRHSLKNILILVGLSVLILLTTFLALKYLNVFYRKLRLYIISHKHLAIHKLKYVLDADKQIKIILFSVRVLRLFLAITVLYFCLFLFFRLFPQTKWLSNNLIGYILSPLRSSYISVKNFIPDLFSIIVIIVLFRFLVKGIRVVAERIEDGSISFSGFYNDWAIPTFNIVKVILYIFMIILIFPHLPGSDSKAFQGVSVFLGILFSLGSTSVIGNIVSGIVITYMRPFKLGDRIRMGEFTGNVIEKTPLVTRLKTPKNEIITIPNGNIMSAQTYNYTTSAEEYGLILYATVAMGYEVPWRKVHELLIEAALATPNVLQEPKPFILQLALDDFYVQYQINVTTREANDMANIYSNLNKNIQDIFHREDIELVSPHYRAQRDGSERMLPKEYIRDSWFHTSPFNMKVHVEKRDDNNNK